MPRARRNLTGASCTISQPAELLRTADEQFARLVAERDEGKLLSTIAGTRLHELQAIVLGRVIAARMGTDRAPRTTAAEPPQA